MRSSIVLVIRKSQRASSGPSTPREWSERLAAYLHKSRRDSCFVPHDRDCCAVLRRDSDSFSHRSLHSIALWARSWVMRLASATDYAQLRLMSGVRCRTHTPISWRFDLDADPHLLFIHHTHLRLTRGIQYNIRISDEQGNQINRTIFLNINHPIQERAWKKEGGQHCALE